MQLLSNPELIRQTVQNPIVRELMMKPDVLNQLISSHPQAKDWLKVQRPLNDLSRVSHVINDSLSLLHCTLVITRFNITLIRL